MFHHASSATMRLSAVLHSCGEMIEMQANLCYMCGGERFLQQFRSQGGVNVLSVHVWVVGGHHGGVICPQMDCLSVGLL